MNRKYLLGSGLRTARIARLFAKFIDLGTSGILGLFFYPWGLIASIFYLCIADSLYDGQSFGKKIVGFAVVSLEDGLPCSPKQSFIRNLPFIVPMFIALFPFWGWILSLIVGIPLMFLELYLLFKLDSTHRLGDVMADTTVIANDQDRVDLRKNRQSWFEKKPSPCN